MVGVMLLLAGCDGWRSAPDPLATEIIDVRVDPNPVVQGQVVKVTVVTPDSLSSDLTYHWVGLEGVGSTREPRIEWQASYEPGEYRFAVSIDRSGSVRISTSFPLEIAARN